MNKNIVIAIVVVLLLLVGGGVIIKNAKKAPTPTPVVQEEVIPTIKPEDIGLTVSARDDKKAVKFTIANAKDITGVDYEISYTASGNIPRGAIGHVDPTAGSNTIETNYIELGSCSSGHCKYDQGVTSVTFVLKISKSNGQTYQTTQTLQL